MFRIGTHTSIAGGIEKAFARSAEVGGNTLQIFAKSPRGWSIPVTTDEQVEVGIAERDRAGQIGGLVHSNYLVNLSKTSDELRQELPSVLHDFEVAYKLGYEAVNVHIGKQKGYADLDTPMRHMADHVDELLTYIDKQGWGRVQFLFENTAGQGSEIGSTVEEIGYFYRTYLKALPVKFCFDTAHCRGGGVDLKERDQVLEQIDEQIGLDQLYCIHLNDSKVPLGSKLDRHASLGRGFIGWETLTPIIQWAASTGRALFIETPDPDLRPDEIAQVKKIVGGDLDRIGQFNRQYAGTQSLKKYEGMIQDGLF